MTLSPLAALRAVFFLNAVGISLWFPRIPDVKAALDVDLFILSICFLMLPAGTLAGFGVAPRVLRRFGTKGTARWVGAVFILAFIPPALAFDAWSLGATLFLAGLTIAPCEVAMNTKATQLEAEGGRRIMASCHAFWSFGAMAGALAGGATGALGASFLEQQILLAPPLAALALAAAKPLPEDAPRLAEGAKPRRVGAMTPALLALCVMPMGALMAEGAMMEWSALFLEAAAGLGPLGAGAVFAGFSLAMAFGRLTGDRLVERFGPARVLTASALVSALALAAFTTSASIVQAMPTAILLGAGAANVYPIAMSLAATVAQRDAESAIATVALTAFSAFLVGPPLIGTVGSALGLGPALFLLAPISLLPLVLIPRILPAKEPAL